MITSVQLPLAILDMLGGSELMVIFLLVLLFFGGEKMPEVARGLAKAIREFKKAAAGVEQEFKRAIEEEPTRPANPPPPSTVPANLPAAPSILPPRPAAANDPASATTSAESPAVGIGAEAVGLAPATPPLPAEPAAPSPGNAPYPERRPDPNKEIHPDQPAEDAG